jgi:hypothetical protein
MCISIYVYNTRPYPTKEERKEGRKEGEKGGEKGGRGKGKDGEGLHIPSFSAVPVELRYTLSTLKGQGRKEQGSERKRTDKDRDVAGK